MKQLLAEQMLDTILVDTKSPDSGPSWRDGDSDVNPKFTARKLTGLVFASRWKDLPSDLARRLQYILPSDVEKCVAYDVEKKKPPRVST